MKWSLKRLRGDRDYILFLLRINTGFRVSNLLTLKVKDVRKKKETVVKEGKAENPRIIYLNNIYEELNEYINTLDGKGWLFPNRKGNKPISRIQAYRQLNKTA